MFERLLLVAWQYSIEPLGLMHLAGVARDAGKQCSIVLLKNAGDLQDLQSSIDSFKPDLVGIQIWTGFHQQMFKVCDYVRALGLPTVIGGPHATYFKDDCAAHADWVVQGHGFRLLHRLLTDTPPKGVLFDEKWSEGTFPMPDRAVLLDSYPVFRDSSIMSMVASVGCPYHCTYCYAPVINSMYGGFRLVLRDNGDLVREGRDIRDRWGASLVYFQDDVFGFDVKWLREFSRRWKEEVGLAFHCQIRIELTLGAVGDERLDLLAAAGCTGITLAIESGHSFLRDHVLFRHMPEESIKEGCAKIMTRGMTLRIEQILAVPFSNLDTELETLRLNAEINPTMAWTSILAPYGGTNMGSIASRYGIYDRTNDDLQSSFFTRSVMRHVEGGPRDIARVVEELKADARSRVLLVMKAEPEADGLSARIVHDKLGPVGTIRYLDEEANQVYCDATARLQALFMWLARVPKAQELARTLITVPTAEWSWAVFSELAGKHLAAQLPPGELARQTAALAGEMGTAPDALPAGVALVPWYFTVFAGSGALAALAVKEGVFGHADAMTGLNALGTLIRRHTYDAELYKVAPTTAPIVTYRPRP